MLKHIYARIRNYSNPILVLLPIPKAIPTDRSLRYDDLPSKRQGSELIEAIDKESKGDTSCFEREITGYASLATSPMIFLSGLSG